eukprot:TRINITY_DN4586_c0_g3_i1.p1 TRINITY_DN4586_c0_g3~~TRINITY_DN4586_c0_g3_i1.p1  ORF type:complete len:325 (+),score=90.66 TRINITY_DN4586_c0_g3_i1:153-1127(+)
MINNGNAKRRQQPMKSTSDGGEEDECEKLMQESHPPKKVFKEESKEANTPNCVKFCIIRVNQDRTQPALPPPVPRPNPLLDSPEKDSLLSPQPISSAGVRGQEFEKRGESSRREGSVREEASGGEAECEVASSKGADERMCVEALKEELRNGGGNDMQEDTLNAEACKLMEESSVADNKCESPEVFKSMKRKKPTPKRNGGKQAADKKTVLENSIDPIEKARILAYMKEQNRPFSAQNVFENLKGEIKKPTIQSILESLVKDGELISKDFSKLMIYMINPRAMPTIPQEEIERQDKEMADCQSQLLATFEHIKERKESKAVIIS